MGQYFQPSIIKLNEDGSLKEVTAWGYSHDYNNGLKLMEHSYIGNNFVNTIENLLFENPCNLVWAGDYADPEPGSEHNINSLGDDDNRMGPGNEKTYTKRVYVKNHTKMEYIKVTKDTRGLVVHPLPLLTAEGNGRGSGDYRGSSSDVGIWARDLISVSDKEPGSEFKKRTVCF